MEKYERAGDSQRIRYKSRCHHDPVWYDHLPYLPFPAIWPIFAPKDKLGDWLEMYTRVMELNYWTKSTAQSASFEEKSGQWTVVVDRDVVQVTLKADMIFASLPFKIMHEFQIPLYDQIRERDADFYAGLEKAGLQLDWGSDGSGLFMKYLRRGSGFVSTLQPQSNCCILTTNVTIGEYALASMYEKPVRILMQEMIPSMGLDKGDVFSRDQAVQQFAEHYPKIKQGTVAAHLIRLSTNVLSRLQCSAKADGSDDHFFKIDSSTFRLYDPVHDPAPISENTPVEEEVSKDEVEGTGEFAYEHDLRDFLARNLYLVEPGLTLYNEEGITGVEYPVGGRFIDILAVDSAGNLMVNELKVSKGYDRVIGQLLRYVHWIKIYLAEGDQKVRGVIIAKTISSDLRLACSELPNVSLREYELAVKLHPVID